MVLVDYSREWKKYQRDFVRLQIQKTTGDLQQVNQSLDRTKLTQLDEQLKQSGAQQQQNEAQIEPKTKKRSTISTRKLYAVTSEAVMLQLR